MTGNHHPDDDEPQKFRFVMPRVDAADRSDDVRGLLRQRLIIVALVFTVAPAIYAARAAWFLGQGARAPGATRLDLVLLCGAFLLTLTLLLMLVRGRRLSVRSLRWIELVGFGHAIALFTWWLFDQLRGGWLEASGELAVAQTAILARFWVLPFFGSLLAYGTLIPNTWRRGAAMVAAIAGCPMLAVLAAGLSGTPYAASTLWMVVLEMGFWLAIAMGLAIFGAHRMEVLRRRVAEARTLGQYRLQRRLGGGGMGDVYLAEHALLRRPCAIKLVRPDRAGDARTQLRFMQEVQATATLSHPNTVQVFDYGHADDGTFYYVMEYLPGVTLEQLVDRHGPLPPSRAIYLLRQICQALCEAHAIGLIHRDIKPSNVIVCERGGRHDTAKLLDFGLAMPRRPSSDRGPALFPNDAVAGTPAYMSPEQAVGSEALDERSDLYSVGALAYFILTGRPPFIERSAVQMLAAHVSELPTPLVRHRTDVPAELETVVLRCLAKRPSDRYAHAAGLERALASCPGAEDWNDEMASGWWRSHAARDDGPTADDANRKIGGTTTLVADDA